jgi:hypothetical protein
MLNEISRNNDLSYAFKAIIASIAVHFLEFIGIK